MATIIKALGVLISAILVWHYSTRRFIDKYNSVIIFGRKGCGKTATLQKLAYKYRNDFKGGIYSNADLVGVHRINGRDVGIRDFPEDSLLLLDEIGIIFPSRDFKNFGLERIEWFKLQRHSKVKMICVSQSWEDTDKAVRILFDKLYLSKKYFRVLTVSKEVIKIMDIANSNVEGEGASAGGKIVDTFKYGFGRIYTWLPHWILLFNSFEVNKKEIIRSKYIEANEMQEDLLTFGGYVKYRVLTLARFVLARVKTALTKTAHSVRGIFGRSDE